VVVVEITAEKDLAGAHTRTENVANWLVRHGVAASAQAIAMKTNEAIGLWTVAKELDAGLIVGGAYGHTRLREWVLGGVTRDLLLQPTCCSVVSH
jgi:nucleotide-binding universal stress UspA family protein